MLYNKDRFQKINSKKVLHKIRKQWVTVSIALLGIISGGVLVNNTIANADTNNANSNNQNNDVVTKQPQSAKNSLVSGQVNKSNVSSVQSTFNVSNNTSSSIAMSIQERAKILHNNIIRNVGRYNLATASSLSSSTNLSAAKSSGASLAKSSSASLTNVSTINNNANNERLLGAKLKHKRKPAKNNDNAISKALLMSDENKVENDVKKLRQVSDQVHIERDEEDFGNTPNNLSSLEQQEKTLKSQENTDETNYVKVLKSFHGVNKPSHFSNPINNELNINVPDIENYIAQNIATINKRHVLIGKDYQDLSRMISQQAMPQWNPNLSLDPQNVYKTVGTSDYVDGHIGSDYDRGIVRNDEDHDTSLLLSEKSDMNADTLNSDNSNALHNSDFHKHYIQVKYSDSDNEVNSKHQIPSDYIYYIMHTNILYLKPSDLSNNPNITSIYNDKNLSQSDAQQRLDKTIADIFTNKIDTGLKNLLQYKKLIQRNGLNLPNNTTFGVSIIQDGNKLGAVYVNGIDNGNHYKQPGIKKLIGNNHIEATDLYGRLNSSLTNYVRSDIGEYISPNRLTSDDIKRYNADWDLKAVSDTDNGSGTDVPLYTDDKSIPMHNMNLGLYLAPDGHYFESIAVKVRDMYTNKIVWTHFIDDAKPGSEVISNGNVNSNKTNYNQNNDAINNCWTDFISKYGNKIASNPEKSYGEMASGVYNTLGKFFISPDIFTYQIPYLSVNEEQALINQIQNGGSSFDTNSNGLIDLPSTHEPDFTNESISQIPDDTNLNNGVNGPWTQSQPASKAYLLAKEIFDDAIKDGFSPDMAAGLVGNAEHEGAGNGNPNQPSDGPDGGQGIFQFTNGKLTQYINWCNENNLQQWTVSDQVKAMQSLFDLPLDLNSTGSDNSDGAATDADYILNSFEIPSDESSQEEPRAYDAELALKYFNINNTQPSTTSNFQPTILNDCKYISDRDSDPVSNSFVDNDVKTLGTKSNTNTFLGNFVHGQPMNQASYIENFNSDNNDFYSNVSDITNGVSNIVSKISDFISDLENKKTISGFAISEVFKRWKSVADLLDKYKTYEDVFKGALYGVKALNSCLSYIRGFALHCDTSNNSYSYLLISGHNLNGIISVCKNAIDTAINKIGSNINSEIGDDIKKCMGETLYDLLDWYVGSNKYASIGSTLGDCADKYVNDELSNLYNDNEYYVYSY